MIAAVILAAGGSARLGRPKQLVDKKGQPLLRHVARAALSGGCNPVVVVLGAAADTVGAALEGLPVDPVLHAGWRRGMSGSIRAGLKRVRERAEGSRGVLLLTSDQPRIDAVVVRRLLGAFDGSERARVASEYEGTLGVPALFGRGWFADLATLEGDRGAKRLLLEPPDTVVRVAWPDGAVDLDRPSDLD